MNLDILRTKDRLDHIFGLASRFAGEPEVQSHWARYLCVLSSGYLEKAVQLILGDYAKSKSAPNVSNYVESQLRWFQSAKMENILSLVQAFSPIWRQELENECDDQVKDAIDSIVANRHLIAHGENVGISLGTISAYYRGAVRFIEILDSKCQP